MMLASGVNELGASLFVRVRVTSIVDSLWYGSILSNKPQCLLLGPKLQNGDVRSTVATGG